MKIFLRLYEKDDFLHILNILVYLNVPHKVFFSSRAKHLLNLAAISHRGVLLPSEVLRLFQ